MSFLSITDRQKLERQAGGPGVSIAAAISEQVESSLDGVPIDDACKGATLLLVAVFLADAAAAREGVTS